MEPDERASEYCPFNYLLLIKCIFDPFLEWKVVSPWAIIFIE